MPPPQDQEDHELLLAAEEGPEDTAPRPPLPSSLLAPPPSAPSSSILYLASTLAILVPFLLFIGMSTIPHLRANEQNPAALVQKEGERGGGLVVGPSSSSSRRPPAFLGCGNWQEDYLDLHRRTLSGELPPRYLVSVAAQAGLADRLVGVISEFYMALLTGRAFQITSAYQRLPRFEAAFDAPFVNWSRPQDPKELIEHLFFTYNGTRGYEGLRGYSNTSGVDTTKYWSLYLVNDDKANEFYSNTNLRHYPMGHDYVETLFVSSNRGRLFDLFDNPYHREQLYGMGLRPETAFGCAVRFLFAPNDAVKRSFATEFDRLQPRPDLLRIGVNIRVGDWAFDPAIEREKLHNLSYYHNYFNCAQSIEGFSRHQQHSQVVWYLISDSSRLRQLALKEYGGDKILTETHAYHHGDCQGFNESCEQSSLDTSIIMATGQVWSMAMTDYQVFSRHSGFGKMGAFLSLQWHSMYGVINGVGRPCGPRDYEALEYLGREWAGI